MRPFPFFDELRWSEYLGQLYRKIEFINSNDIDKFNLI